MTASTSSIDYHTIVIPIDDELFLRSLQESDGKPLWEGINQPEVAKYLFSVNYPVDYEMTEKWLRKAIAEYDKEEPSKLNFAILYNEEPVGAISLNKINFETHWGEIGYWLSVKHHRKGIMTRALQALISFSFEELGIETLSASVFEGNAGSSGVLKKCGFEKQDEMIKITKGDTKVPAHVFVLKKEDEQ